MDTREFLETVCSKIKYKPAKQHISEELQSHIEEIKNDYLCKGYSPKEAELKAIKQMGNAEKIGSELNKIHKFELDWKLILLMAIIICFGFLIDNLYCQNLHKSNTGFYCAIIVGVLFSIIIYFLDYKKIKLYSKTLYILAALLSIIEYATGLMLDPVPYENQITYLMRIFGWISQFSFVVIPLYIISFAGFIEKVKANKNDISKILITSIFSIVTLFLINRPYMLIVAITYIVLTIMKMKKEDSLNLKNIFLTIVTYALLIFVLFANVNNYNLHFIKEKIRDAFFPDTPLHYNVNGKLITLNEYSHTLNVREIVKNAKPYGKSNLNLNDMSTVDNENYALLKILAYYGWGITITLIIAILLLSTKLIINAKKITDIYGKFLVVGISSLFIIQIILGISLNFGFGFGFGLVEHFNIPFVSLGRIDLIINMMCIALILSVYRRKNLNFNNEITNAVI